MEALTHRRFLCFLSDPFDRLMIALARIEGLVAVSSYRRPPCRLVYQVLEDERVVKVPRLWSHYE